MHTFDTINHTNTRGTLWSWQMVHMLSGSVRNTKAYACEYSCWIAFEKLDFVNNIIQLENSTTAELQTWKLALNDTSNQLCKYDFPKGTNWYRSVCGYSEKCTTIPCLFGSWIWGWNACGWVTVTCCREADRNTRCWQPENCDCSRSFSNKKSRQMLEMTERSWSAVTDFSARQDPAAAHCTRHCVCKLCCSAPRKHKSVLIDPARSSGRTFFVL